LCTDFFDKSQDILYTDFFFLRELLVQLAQTDRGLFHDRRAAFSSMLKSRVGNTLAKAAALRVHA
jgi:hypothetical protein